MRAARFTSGLVHRPFAPALVIAPAFAGSNPVPNRHGANFVSGVRRAVFAEPGRMRVGMAHYRTCTVGHDRHFIGTAPSFAKTTPMPLSGLSS